ncbi:hypothetical protein KCH_00510 [Kitasatospora cheerisanensis KCTC 2395]|uniref:Uncharacterized protein n=1 Tax=Kitasatospora cheerisanensis KCTC 2395 TaxID=1348663 RepID=A0A066ZD20_9ACTN|nr:hypothetical protein KCH_00510 [Kitasatospora cheerisanensis KCTC 2395]
MHELVPDTLRRRRGPLPGTGHVREDLWRRDPRSANHRRPDEPSTLASFPAESTGPSESAFSTVELRTEPAPGSK